MGYSYRQHSVQAALGRSQDPLRRGQNALHKHRAELGREPPPADFSYLIDLAGLVLLALTNALGRFDVFLETLEQARDKRAEYLRYLQHEAGSIRPVKSPDLLTTGFLVMLFVLLEGGLSGALMIADGKMLMIEGMAYGLIFAFINVIVALMTGYFGLRHVISGVTKMEKSLGDLISASLGALGSLIGVITLAVLVFSAARVRTLGGHEEIFSYDEISFAATFNDGIAILILVVGAASSLISIWKGYSGLSDRMPGFSEAKQFAEGGILEQLRDAVEDVVEHLDDTVYGYLDECDEALEDAESALKDYSDEINAYNTDVREHNANVASAREAVLLHYEDRRSLEAHVTHRKVNARRTPPENLFEQFIAAELPLPEEGKHAGDASQIERLREVMAEVRLQHQSSVSAIRERAANFRINAPNLEIFTETVGD